MSEIWKATYNKHLCHAMVEIKAGSPEQAAWIFFSQCDLGVEGFPKPDVFYKGIIAVWQEREDVDSKEMYNVTDFEIDDMLGEIEAARSKFIWGKMQ